MLLTFETYQLNSEQVTRILKEQGRPDVIDYILRMALILTMERDSKNHFIESVKSQNEVKPDLDFIFNILTRELKCTIHIYMDNPDTPIISRINNPNDELNINLLYFKQNDYWALLLHEDEIAFDNGQTCDLNRFPFIHRSNSVRPIVAPSAREPRVATRFNADFELLELTKSLTDLIQSNEISLTGNTKTILLTRMSNILSVMPD